MAAAGASPAYQYPVLAEIWSQLEASLSVQARKLSDDIAKRNGADPKELWAKIKPMIRVSLLDFDLPDSSPTLCPYPTGQIEGVMITRCRIPCLLGFSACAEHIHKPMPLLHSTHESVKRIFDYKGNTYFIDTHSVAYDVEGTARGIVKEDTLCLFEECFQ